MATTRNRNPAPINYETAELNFNKVLNTISDEDFDNGVSATALSRSCGTWRKINRYLNLPTSSPYRQEAETVLKKLNVKYVRGACNSRTFFIDMS